MKLFILRVELLGVSNSCIISSELRCFFSDVVEGRKRGATCLLLKVQDYNEVSFMTIYSLSIVVRVYGACICAL